MSIQPSPAELASLPTVALLEHLQHAAFAYFQENLYPLNGLASEVSRPDSPVSIAVIGFALSAYPPAGGYGWLSRAKALRWSLAALCFFCAGEQSLSVTATGNEGFCNHFLGVRGGARSSR